MLLIINSGSSSVKYLLCTNQYKELLRGHVDGIGLPTCHINITVKGHKTSEKVKVSDHLDAMMHVFTSLRTHANIKDFSQIRGVGHRVVHGGERFCEPTKITPTIITKLKSYSVLAPLHNPPAIAGILASMKIVPRAPQFAVFDTAFHHTIPKEAFLYGLPIDLYKEHGIRKYGFHGINHEFVAKQAMGLLHKQHGQTHRIITCHLGNGSSITAVKDGKSIDTSMGFTPLDGVIMGTRSGSLDPEVLLYLIRNQHYTPERLEKMLQHESGLRGIAGSSDVRELRARALKKDPDAVLALNMLSYRVAKFVSSYLTALNGADAIVFTGGIGQQAHYIRKSVCEHLSFLGLKLDLEQNRKNATVITKPTSKVKVFVIPANEELSIARSISSLLRK